MDFDTLCGLRVDCDVNHRTGEFRLLAALQVLVEASTLMQTYLASRCIPQPATK